MIQLFPDKYNNLSVEEEQENLEQIAASETRQKRRAQAGIATTITSFLSLLLPIQSNANPLERLVQPTAYEEQGRQTKGWVHLPNENNYVIPKATIVVLDKYGDIQQRLEKVPEGDLLNVHYGDIIKIDQPTEALDVNGKGAPIPLTTMIRTAAGMYIISDNQRQGIDRVIHTLTIDTRNSCMLPGSYVVFVEARDGPLLIRQIQYKVRVNPEEQHQPKALSPQKQEQERQIPEQPKIVDQKPAVTEGPETTEEKEDVKETKQEPKPQASQESNTAGKSAGTGIANIHFGTGLTSFTTAATVEPLEFRTALVSFNASLQKNAFVHGSFTYHNMTGSDAYSIGSNVNMNNSRAGFIVRSRSPLAIGAEFSHSKTSESGAYLQTVTNTLALGKIGFASNAGNVYAFAVGEFGANWENTSFGDRYSTQRERQMVAGFSAGAFIGRSSTSRGLVGFEFHTDKYTGSDPQNPTGTGLIDGQSTGLRAMAAYRVTNGSRGSSIMVGGQLSHSYDTFNRAYSSTSQSSTGAGVFVVFAIGNPGK